MQYGSEVIVVDTGDSKVSTVTKYHLGVPSTILKNFEERVKVDDYAQAAKEFEEFNKMLEGLGHKVTASFAYEFDRKERTKSFFVIKSYSVLV